MSRISMRAARKTSSLLVLSFLALSSLWGQGEAVNARLTGAVLDPDEAVVAGAKVTISNSAAGFTRQFTTADNGQYTFTLVPPGRYQLKVEKEGFSTYLQPNIVLAVGQSSTLNPRLELGPLSQTIEVTADAPLLNSGNANLGAEVAGKQAVELPLNLRNVFNLVLLSSSVNNPAEYEGLT
ncbi:MAG TPA: carboxypeptidase-like regulatory domain-containing protein [Bryobacterales bacterium]|nr:carboxypeptidase-like regulatory domain-containing protein [Bryobacterales bacterium]